MISGMLMHPQSQRINLGYHHRGPPFSPLPAIGLGAGNEMEGEGCWGLPTLKKMHKAS